MLLNFDKSPFFCLPEKIFTLLNNELAKLTVPDVASSGVTFNFRDDMQESNEHIELFLNNFISYVEMGIFNVNVSFD